ncbi:hypothetical protein SORBI_3002G112850, partial [Sorghum bicolor]
MDLNKLPPGLDEDFLDAFDFDYMTSNPTFCTQVSTNPEIPQPNDEHVNQQILPSISEDGHAGLAETDPAVSEEFLPTISEIRLSFEQTRIEVRNEDSTTNPVVAEVAEEEEEVWSTPEMPHNGMSFATLDEAREYYNSYAKRTGFSIRTNTSRRSAITREKQKVQFVCNKEGFGRKRRVVVQLVDGITCYSDNDEAEEEDTAQEEEDEQVEKRKKWQVIYFLAEHNHDLVVQPSLKKFLRSHRGIPKQEKDFIVLLHGCNLSTGRIMQLMSEFYGSAQLVPYDGKQVSNFRSTIHKTEKFKDMQETLDYFRALKEEDPEFFYKIKLDDNHRVENLFWVDSATRCAYKEAYNDCVSFDATYMTNIYEMPCTPFIGINRHCQTFQLGCAFIRNEKTTTYEWLFLTFLEAMDRKAPLNIITDQDPAMRDAICIVFPNTTHRNCRWHIMDKFSGTIGPILAKNDELNEEFKYGLEDNEHFQHLYHIRQSFIPAYYMHSFFPFLQSTQRSEGFNALLKKYVNPNLSVLQFVRQYQKIQEKCLVAQDGQDFRTDENERRRWSRHPLEKHASTVYTKNMFYRNYLVTAIEEDESYCCECSKFDRDGIICYHIMRVMVRMGVELIPERYILKRWTQQAIASDTNQVQNLNAPVGLVARGMPLTSEKTLRLTNATTAFVAIAVEGCTNDENYAILEKHIKEMRSEFEEIKKRTMANRQNTSGAKGGATEGAQNGTEKTVAEKVLVSKKYAYKLRNISK